MTLDPAVRFERKVNRSPGQGPNGDCHEWRAGRNAGGYGIFHIATDQIDPRTGRWRWAGRLAHRAAWFLATGGWPALHVLHRCDNPACVRIDHLFLGTQADNCADKVAKGRCSRARAKITPAQVLEIRALRGQESQSATAARYGIGRSRVSEIQSGKSWAHV